MDDIREILKKQMELLAKKADKGLRNPQELYLITKAMCNVARTLYNLSFQWLAPAPLQTLPEKNS